jgi:hypothetical protein
MFLRSRRSRWIPFLFLLGSLSAFADYCGGILQLESISGASKKYALPQGASVRLREEGTENAWDMVFIGRTFRLDRSTQDFAFFESKTSMVHFFDAKKIRIETLGEDGSGTSYGKIAPLVRSRNQQGNTCAAYAIFNCFRQLHELGHTGNGNLAVVLADEGDRQDFLAALINELYIVATQGREMAATVRQSAHRLGFSAEEVMGPTLPGTVLGDLEQGRPVLLRFDCGQTQCELPYRVLDHSEGQRLSTQLWQPRKGREPTPGGHAILLSGVFSAADGTRWIVAHDPNFQAPRLWPVANLDRFDEARIRAWIIREKTP